MAISSETNEKNLEFLQWELTTTLEYLKDKEKKKLMMAAGSFAVFSILVTVLSVSKTGVLLSQNAVFLIVMLGIVIINLSVIKYIIALKADSIIAMRQINCVRQAILSCIYKRINGVYPDNEKDLTNQYSEYGIRIGSHIKFQINNKMIRKQYRKFAIRWYSADLATIHFIALYTVILALYPILTKISIEISNTPPPNPPFSALMGAVGLGTAILFSFIAIITVNQGIETIRRQLEKDSGGEDRRSNNGKDRKEKK